MNKKTIVIWHCKNTYIEENVSIFSSDCTFSVLDYAFYILWSSGFPVSVFRTLSLFFWTWELNNLSWLCSLTQQWLQYWIWNMKSMFLTKQDYFCLFGPHKQYLIWASVAQTWLFLNAGMLNATQGRDLCSRSIQQGKAETGLWRHAAGADTLQVMFPFP